VNEISQTRDRRRRRARGDAERPENAGVLERLCEAGTNNIGRLRHSVRRTAFFRKLHVDGVGLPGVVGVTPELLRRHPIAIERGFEGNTGIEGGFWPSNTRKDDALLFLRFANGTVDLPLHTHEFSDRFILVDDGIGLFHHSPSKEEPDELRSLIVRPGDVLAFTRGLLHTFTAPFGDLTLLSYHSPFFEFDDTRQFTIPAQSRDARFEWLLGRLVSVDSHDGTAKVATAR
jgi:hypothetical protein